MLGVGLTKVAGVAYAGSIDSQGVEQLQVGTRKSIVGASLPQQTLDTLFAVYGRLYERLSRPLSSGRLSLARMHVLEWLSDHDGASMSELGAALHISRTAVTQLVTGLEADALVVRAEHPIDRRSRLVRITDAGRVALQQALPAHQERVERLLTDLNPEEQRQLIELLGKLDHDFAQPG
jgi:DNA-binding MarR family transcriptional regulator